MKRYGSSLAAVAVALSGAFVPVFPSAARADGVFAQIDAADTATDAVGVVAHGPLSFGLGYSSYEGGSTTTASATYALPAGPLGTFRFGPALSRAQGSDDESWRLGAQLSLERYVSLGSSHVFGLAQYNTIDRNRFAALQIGLTRKIDLDLTIGGSDNYHSRTVGLSWKVGEGPFSLRAGYKLVAHQVYLGVSYNTF